MRVRSVPGSLSAAAVLAGLLLLSQPGRTSAEAIFDVRAQVSGAGFTPIIVDGGSGPVSVSLSGPPLLQPGASVSADARAGLGTLGARAEGDTGDIPEFIGAV